MTPYISRNPNSSHQPSCLVFFSLKKKITLTKESTLTVDFFDFLLLLIIKN
ncbi:hypothetical protein Peur_047891 [Populus x canadensis]